MKNNYVRFLVFFLLASIFIWTSDTAFAQNTSNKGKDFWLGYGNHVRLNNTEPADDAKMVLYITSDVNTTAQITVPGINFTSPVITIVANTVQTVEIPSTAHLSGEGKYNRGIHVVAQNPVVVYSHIFALNVSGATLVLPTNTLGKDYYSINYTQRSNEGQSYSYFFVVATEDNTDVEITPARPTFGGRQANVPFVVRLNKGEIYQVLANDDLTGSRIRSVSTTSDPCKRIAVFAGSGKIMIGCGTASSSDNLYQQVYPTVAWGKKFVSAPLKSRAVDYIRVVKSDPTAKVTRNGVPIPDNQFTNNFYHEFKTQAIEVIESDKSIQVIQYSASQNQGFNCNTVADLGDPEMIYLNPLEQTLSKITMYSSNQYQIVSHFINVTIPTPGVSSFRLDGQAQTAQFLPVPGLAGYSYAQLSVTSGVHNLIADIGFNAIAYGFGNAESYGYAAGANLDFDAIETESAVARLLTNSGCVGEPIIFKVKLPYEASELQWDLGNGQALIVVSNPVPSSTFTDGDKLFRVYTLAGQYTYAQAGTVTIKVLASKTSSDDCGSIESVEREFDVFNPPTVAFTPPEAVCANVEVQFTDQSDGNGRALKTWLWDFGDGSTSAERNPKHTYTAGGDYIIKLTITNESNCSPAVATKTIHINRLPTASFTTTGPYCKDGTISFKDTSVPNEGAVAAWLWDFGDGTTSQDKDPTHIYTSTGTYTVSLIVTTDKSCKNVAITKTVMINPVPAVDFITPEICLRDTRAQFTDNSTITDGSEGQFTYLWNFGDANATPGNPNTSTQKNPSHNYLAIGLYQVSLTVTSKDGCSSTLVKDFTVNGSVPVAAFTVQNASSLCSAIPVVVQDRASVDFGQLTKIEWYFDYPNKPVPDITDNDPAKRADPARSYTFQYPVFHSPASRQVTIRMVAYSGTLCVDDELITVTLLAQPEVEFTALSNVCINVPTFQLTQARERHGVLNGTGVYSGRGVSGSTFDPSAAGTGTHTITYTYTATNGCTDSESRDITVYSLPVADAGPDLVVLEGGEVRIDATASGSNLTYKWSPSTGLDRDDILTPVVKPINDITYTLVVTSAQGCTTMDNVVVKVLKAPDVPNTFTPNGDGLNDVWNIKYLDSYPEATVEVFNRYGVKVFASNRYAVPWDGTFQGNGLPVGTYYYVINPRNGRKVMSGSVTILR